MKPPTTYAEWVRALDMMKEGHQDDLILQAMEGGQLEWQSGLAERFTASVANLLDVRLKQLGNNLQRNLDNARAEEANITRALVTARLEFASLMRLAGLSVLPEDVRASLTGMVIQYASQIQNALETGGRADRTGRLLSLLRKNPLTRFTDSTPALDRPSATGRRIVL